MSLVKRLKLAISSRRDNFHLNEIINGTAIAFLYRVTGALLAFAFNVVLGRLLGVEGAGIYFLAISVVAVSSVVCKVGLDNVVLRSIASSVSHNNPHYGEYVRRISFRIVILVSATVTLLVFLLSEWIAVTLFSKPEFLEPLKWISLSILPFSLLTLYGESFKGLKKIKEAMVLQSLGIPLISLALIYPLVIWSTEVGAEVAYFIGAAGTALFAGYLWKINGLHCDNINIDNFSRREFINSSSHFYVVDLINKAVLPWVPLFLLGIWASTQDLGLYGAASRVAMLVSMMLAMSNSIVAPKFAELYATKDIGALKKNLKYATLLATVIAIPLVAIIIAANSWILSLFGEGFSEGGAVLVILAIGQLINAVCGPVGYLLSMTGNERVYMINTIISCIVLFATGSLFIGEYGAVGAAYAATLSLITLNVLSLIAVKQKLKVGI